MASSMMQVDAVSTLSGNRKRSVRHRDADSDDEQPVAADQLDTPRKRLRNSKGDAIHRRELKYNAQALLNNLAFTQLYVTANFQFYNPALSPVILCIIAERDVLYRTLCQVLPALYNVAPNLQAIAVITQRLEEAARPDQGLMRVMPARNLNGLQESTIDDLQQFAQAVPGSADSIVVVSPIGACVWTSDELQVNDSAPVRGADRLTSDLERALIRVLTKFAQPELMDED
ncbi:hypothetical protein LTR36_002289 [Oleoguttula mirabilis]|uniref:Uncharacterized protein n=1 Tax=Oleoguttula mirabilis TaxID=1507867 RepID=A0AAV9JLF5_9PEZI|nr:hypothetical protein LTR36_002289 [Oleoguttula mirabilis]